jgi:uncharacterized protein YggE
MKRSICFFILALSACSQNLPVGAVNSEALVPKIYTSAFAEKRVEPNMARVTFAVLTRASQAEKARNENALKVTSIMNKLNKLKIQSDDIQTLDYSLREIMSYDKGTSKIDAYEVINRLSLKVVDVKNLGKIVDQLVPLGANRVDQIEFDISERNDVYKELLEEATEQARDKALHIAEAGGIGKIVVLEVREESTAHSTPFGSVALMRAEGVSGATPVSASAYIRAQVSLTAKAKN